MQIIKNIHQKHPDELQALINQAKELDDAIRPFLEDTGRGEDYEEVLSLI